MLSPRCASVRISSQSEMVSDVPPPPLDEVSMGSKATISDCEEILTDAHLGDSIAVNGILLFVYNTWDIV
jgi:riboflavin synthase alpha subunit